MANLSQIDDTTAALAAHRKKSAARKLELRRCMGCGVEFWASPQQRKNFCSTSCWERTPNSGARVPRVCSHCNKTFQALRRKKTNLFCSRECAAAGRAQPESVNRRRTARLLAAAYPDPDLLEVFNRLRPGSPGHFFGWRRVG